MIVVFGNLNKIRLSYGQFIAWTLIGGRIFFHVLGSELPFVPMCEGMVINPIVGVIPQLYIIYKGFPNN